MAIVKTAISIQESLFERADALAQQLHLSRSQLFARALDEYLKKHESRKLLEAINSALESEPDPGEAERMRLMRQKQRRRVEGQWGGGGMVVTSAPMWTSTRFTERFGCRYPIVQGPMGGGASTPELVAAVSNAGGLGSLGCYHLEPAAILSAAADIRRLTDRPFNLNLWISREREDGGSLGPSEAGRALARLQPYRDELGLPPLAEPPAPTVQDFEQQFEAVLEARPAVFSFIFGLLPAPLAAEARRRGIALIGTATTVEEAEALEESGVDLVVASGFEAGGHRGSFLRPAEQSLTGTFSLVPQVASAVRVPVLAAGGIADGRGVAAALVLGASAAQIGTAFLLCRESGASERHRAALADRTRARRTALSRAYTGRLARMLANRVTDEMAQPPAELLPYPHQNELTRELRLAAARTGRDDLLPFYGGQSAPLASPRSAADLMVGLVAETGAALSLGENDDTDVEEQWGEEAEARYREIESGKVTPIPSDDVLREARSRLK